VSMAILSLVPTPSLAATRTGSTKPAALRSKRPPKPPISPSAPGRRVERTAGVIASASALPASISTPACLYERPFDGRFCASDMSLLPMLGIAGASQRARTGLVELFGAGRYTADSFLDTQTQGPPGAMNLRNQVLIWIGFFVVLILSLWIFRGILLPFVVGAALAYLLNPLVNQLQRWRFSRMWATVVVLLSILSIIVSLFFMLVPVIGQQIIELIQRTPSLYRDLQGLVTQYSPEISAWLGPERAAEVERGINEVARNLLGFIARLPAELVNIG